MKYVYVFLIVLVLISACNQASQPEEQNQESNEEAGSEQNQETQNNEIKIDTDEDGITDVTVKDDGKTVEVEVPIDEVEVKGEWCIPGSSYKYESDKGTVDSEVIGLEMYKGKEFCKSFSKSVIPSPAGEITSETTYYFDSDHNEYWIIVKTSSPMMPEPQVNEIHIIDGETQ